MHENSMAVFTIKMKLTEEIDQSSIGIISFCKWSIFRVFMVFSIFFELFSI